MNWVSMCDDTSITANEKWENEKEWDEEKKRRKKKQQTHNNINYDGKTIEKVFCFENGANKTSSMQDERNNNKRGMKAFE